MGGADKTLKVAYGSFSCTLEGFDDPVATLRAITEHFQSLSAPERLFAADGPVPGPDLLLTGQIKAAAAARPPQTRPDPNSDPDGGPLAAPLPAVRAPGQTNRDVDVSRLLSQTNGQMDRADQRRRQATIGHLKAAVAVTEDDPGAGAGEDPARAARYRADLAADLAGGVRPGRPAGVNLTAPDLTAPDLTPPDLTPPDLTPPDLTPLALSPPSQAAEYQIALHLSAPNLNASAKPVPNSPVPNSPFGASPIGASPVAASPIANMPVANTPVGNMPAPNWPVPNRPAPTLSGLNTLAPNTLGPTALDLRPPPDKPSPLLLAPEQRVSLPPAPPEANPRADASMEPPGFALLAERIKVASLADLIEAAAAFTVCVEGATAFTRPDLMRHLAALPNHRGGALDDQMRGFGRLLREGRFLHAGQGRFALPEDATILAQTRRLMA